MAGHLPHIANTIAEASADLIAMQARRMMRRAAVL
jgi:hypothetical protein